ncbi:MAG: translesion error-prone DNA polymerase V autoproteolytic subunit [Deltaproteobacteria bacterium]|nr:translesion error-prone DNA polymerase V autoproteolytic subunit [Deltaproteobacteria bacterium]
MVYEPEVRGEVRRPLGLSAVPAGFPSPAEDYIDATLDLNDYLIKHPAATFFMRVEGESMVNAGIHDGDILIVDRSLEPDDGRVVVAVVGGDMTVKRISKRGGRILLVPENDAYAVLEVAEDRECWIWGVVTNVIHRL